MKRFSHLPVGVVVVSGMFIAQKFFGFKVPDKKTRRRARERRKIVIWKYERD